MREFQHNRMLMKIMIAIWVIGLKMRGLIMNNKKDCSDNLIILISSRMSLNKNHRIQPKSAKRVSSFIHKYIVLSNNKRIVTTQQGNRINKNESRCHRRRTTLCHTTKLIKYRLNHPINKIIHRINQAVIYKIIGTINKKTRWILSNRKSINRKSHFPLH
jgi:hypothetical protein